MVRVFVYGTLKRGHRLSDWMANSAYVAKATCYGCVLTSMGPYPALIYTGLDNQGVKGEVWDMPERDYGALAAMESSVGYDAVDMQVVMPLPDDAARTTIARIFVYLDLSKPCLHEWNIDTTISNHLED